MPTPTDPAERRARPDVGGDKGAFVQMPKAVTAVAHWLAAGNNFDRLSAGQRRAAWSSALLTHLLLLPVAVVLVGRSPVLRPTLGTYLLTHFLVSLLIAKVAEATSGLWELVWREQPRFERNGWLFAFGVTLVPLLATSSLVWLFR